MLFDIIFDNNNIYLPINMGSEYFQHFQNNSLLDYGIFNSVNLNTEYIAGIQEMKSKKVCYAKNTQVSDIIERLKGDTPQESLNFIISYFL